jgi:hypothetical protein
LVEGKMSCGPGGGFVSLLITVFHLRPILLSLTFRACGGRH